MARPEAQIWKTKSLGKECRLAIDSGWGRRGELGVGSLNRNGMDG